MCVCVCVSYVLSKKTCGLYSQYVVTCNGLSRLVTGCVTLKKMDAMNAENAAVRCFKIVFKWDILTLTHWSSSIRLQQFRGHLKPVCSITVIFTRDRTGWNTLIAVELVSQIAMSM